MVIMFSVAGDRICAIRRESRAPCLCLAAAPHKRAELMKRKTPLSGTANSSSNSSQQQQLLLAVPDGRVG